MTNIFRNAYEQPENKLTYCFLSVLGHLDFKIAAQLLAESNLPIGGCERLRVELLYGGQEANPDGSIVFEGPESAITVFFENKTWRRRLDIEQIRRHIRIHLNASSNHHLLVITTDQGHRDELKTLEDPRIHFMTWHQIAASAERLAREAIDSKDQFLLSEFQEYLETSGEAWRARMLDSKLIAAHSQFLKASPDENRFLKECQRLMDALRDDVATEFSEEIEGVTTEKARYGRVGNECTLRNAPFGQWLFFGVYYDPQDHKIDLKVPYQAEFAVFFDIQKNTRETLPKSQNLQHAISALKVQGYEFNFPEDECGNPWRMCFWREPMSKYEGASLSELRKMFEIQLTKLFASDFYRIAGGGQVAQV